MYEDDPTVLIEDLDLSGYLVVGRSVSTPGGPSTRRYRRSRHERGGRGVASALVIAMLLLGLVIGYARSVMLRRDAEALVDALVDDLATRHEEVRVTRNRVVTLEKLLRDGSEMLTATEAENAVLAELVSKLRSRPAEIRYVTRVETRVEPGPSTVTAELPDEHLFRLDNGMVVSRFHHAPGEDEPYRFETYGQRWVLRGAIGERDSSFLLFGATDYDDELRPVPVDVQVSSVQPRIPKLVDPRLSLGVGGAVGLRTGNFTYGPTLSLMLLHPPRVPDLDLVGLRFMLGQDLHQDLAARGGVDVLAYNVGSPLPWVDDLWLSLGASFGNDLEPSVDVGLSTRL